MFSDAFPLVVDARPEGVHDALLLGRRRVPAGRRPVEERVHLPGGRADAGEAFRDHTEPVAGRHGRHRQPAQDDRVRQRGADRGARRRRRLGRGHGAAPARRPQGRHGVARLQTRSPRQPSPLLAHRSDFALFFVLHIDVYITRPNQFNWLYRTLFGQGAPSPPPPPRACWSTRWTRRWSSSRST